MLLWWISVNNYSAGMILLHWTPFHKMQWPWPISACDHFCKGKSSYFDRRERGGPDVPQRPKRIQVCAPCTRQGRKVRGYKLEKECMKEKYIYMCVFIQSCFSCWLNPHVSYIRCSLARNLIFCLSNPQGPCTLPLATVVRYTGDAVLWTKRRFFFCVVTVASVFPLWNPKMKNTKKCCGMLQWGFAKKKTVHENPLPPAGLAMSWGS